VKRGGASWSELDGGRSRIQGERQREEVALVEWGIRDFDFAWRLRLKVSSVPLPMWTKLTVSRIVVGMKMVLMNRSSGGV
jgi:hypothetical protein